MVNRVLDSLVQQGIINPAAVDLDDLALLERAGFTDITFYGSYDLDPFTSASERMIAVAAKPGA